MIDTTLAQEYLDLHNDEIRAAHELSGNSALSFFLKATERQEGENNGMGELVYEISGDDSYSGHPVEFEVPDDIWE